tara:strand:- start:19 stop:390 length:372 start_codon:yes stop_codon:yes gene_type:complete
MLAKLIVWAPNRAMACERLSQVLRDTVYLGIPTNVDFLRRIVDDEAFRTAAISTDMLSHRPELAAGDDEAPDDHVLAAAVLCQALARQSGSAGGHAANSSASTQGSTAVWQDLSGFRLFEVTR